MGLLMFVVQSRHILLPKVLKRIVGPVASSLLVVCAIVQFNAPVAPEEDASATKSEEDISAFAVAIGSASQREYSKEVADLFAVLKDDQTVGVLLEGPKGELLAGHGDFLTRDGRRYSSNEQDAEVQTGDLVEMITRNVSLETTSDSTQPRAAVLRVFKYQDSDSVSTASLPTK